MPIKYFILTQFHLCLQHFQKVSSKLCHTSPQHLPCNINIFFLLVLCTSYLQNADLLSTNLAPELISIQASNKNKQNRLQLQLETYKLLVSKVYVLSKLQNTQIYKLHAHCLYFLVLWSYSEGCGHYGHVQCFVHYLCLIKSSKSRHICFPSLRRLHKASKPAVLLKSVPCESQKWTDAIQIMGEINDCKHQSDSL